MAAMFRLCRGRASPTGDSTTSHPWLVRKAIAMCTRFKASIWAILAIAILSVLPAWGDSPEEGDVLELPYVAVGGEPDGWHFQTVLFLSSLHQLSNSGTIEFLGQDGEPLPLRLNDGAELVAQTEWSVSASQSQLLVLTHPGSGMQTGSLRVKLSVKSPMLIAVLVQFYSGNDLAGTVGIVATPKNETSSPYYAAASPGRPFRH